MLTTMAWGAVTGAVWAEAGVVTEETAKSDAMRSVRIGRMYGILFRMPYRITEIVWP
jgi:hypothetical protein